VPESPDVIGEVTNHSALVQDPVRFVNRSDRLQLTGERARFVKGVGAVPSRRSVRTRAIVLVENVPEELSESAHEHDAV
jgi:hypothetical protein